MEPQTPELSQAISRRSAIGTFVAVLAACNFATAAPSRHDVRLDAGTHLMHLETGRHRLYDAVGRALKGEQP